MCDIVNLRFIKLLFCLTSETFLSINMSDSNANNDDNNSRHKRLNLLLNHIAIAGPSNVKRASNNNQSITPQIFKLNVDCFEHLFEWFSLRELLKFRCTCKRMQKAVDYYIKLNYSRLRLMKIRQTSLVCERFCLTACQMFLELGQTRLNHFEWIKHLYLSHFQITADQADSVAYILNELETLKLSEIVIDGDFYEIILVHCKQLKYLGVKTRYENYIGIDNEWLLRTYPTLKHFEIQTFGNTALEVYSEPDQCSEILAFLHLNSNIQSFSTNSDFFVKRCHQMLETNIQIDYLNIIYNQVVDMILVRRLANDLHFHGIYKRLHFTIDSDSYTSTYSENIIDNMQHIWTINNLVSLELYKRLDYCTIPMVESINEIIFHNPSFPLNTLKLMATNFINLNRVYMEHAREYHILPFIRFAPRLERIYAYHSQNLHFSDLHEKRKKLAGARKVTIYVDEKIVLKMKNWDEKLINTDLIKVERIESCELNHVSKWA